jgi:hypothetical protein
MSTPTTPTAKWAKPTKVAKLPAPQSTDKISWYEIAFDNGEGGLLGMDPASPQPALHTYMCYGLEVLQRKTPVDGSATWNKIHYPIAPALRPPAPRPEVAEVVKPIENPAQPAVTETTKVVAPEKAIPDNTPRKGVVATIDLVGDFTPQDGAKQLKYVVTFLGGASGIMWFPEGTPPVIVGQEINYTYGKVYQDGSKRIDMAPIGSAVDKDTIEVRLRVLEAVAGLYAQRPELEFDTKYVRAVAEDLEQWVMREA